jgi:hypothetical protein
MKSRLQPDKRIQRSSPDKTISSPTSLGRAGLAISCILVPRIGRREGASVLWHDSSQWAHQCMIRTQNLGASKSRGVRLTTLSPLAGVHNPTYDGRAITARRRKVQATVGFHGRGVARIGSYEVPSAAWCISLSFYGLLRVVKLSNAKAELVFLSVRVCTVVCS